MNSIKLKSVNLTMDPIEINNKFRDFYQQLYKSKYKANNKTVQKLFLDQLQFQTISEDERTALDSALTTEDLSEAIGDINSVKSPGPDGLPVEFYKTFKRKLVRPLLDMY